MESQYRIIALPDGRQMDVGISYVYDVNGMRTQKSILTRWFAGTTSAPVEYMVDEQYDYVYNGSSLSQLKVTTETTVGNGSGTYVIGYFDTGVGLSYYDYFYVPSSDETIAGICALIGLYALFSGAGVFGAAGFLPGLLPA